jgi:PKD repeat protein
LIRLAVAFLLAGELSVKAANFYVSPTGTTSTGPGTGTISNPWALQTALSQPSAVHPGDTIWLRGGTYVGTYTSYLSGTASQPIVVRQYPGERAKLDGGTANTSVLLTVSGSYTWFWGFEITSSSTDRASTQTGSSPTDLNRPYECISNAQQPGSGVGIKIINMVIHNCGQGIGIWQDATNSEIYGSLIYYNGWNAPDRTHGHGIYSQNAAPSRRTVRDNIVYGNYSYNIQVYAESARLDNHTIDGNVCFWDAAAANPPGGGATINMGGGASATGNALTNNAFYGFPGGGALDFSRGNQNVTMTGNMSGFPVTSTDGEQGGYIDFGTNSGSVNISSNTFYTSGASPSNYRSLYPSNTYIIWPTNPTGTRILVRPNSYEPGRGHVAVFNWGHAASVSVDLSSVLSVGSSYEIRNAQNFFGTPTRTGTYAGGTVSIPMATSSVEVPAGAAAPNPTGPEFNAFIVLTAGSVPPSPPGAAFTFSPASPQTNSVVTFTDTSTGNPTSWSWSFGDGGTSTLRNPTHTYAAAGTYVVALTATNVGGSDQTTRSVTVTAPPVSSAPTRFYTLSPCRVIDTRNPNGPAGGPALAANGARIFPVTGACGIPSNATTVSVNIAVVGPLAPGQLRIYPGNSGIPPTSVVNFRAGQTRANNAMVVLATDGAGTIGVKNDAAGTVHFVLDVNGYFE